MDNLTCPKKKHAWGYVHSSKEETLLLPHFHMYQTSRRPYHVCNTVLTSWVKSATEQQLLHHMLSTCETQCGHDHLTFMIISACLKIDKNAFSHTVWLEKWGTQNSGLQTTTQQVRLDYLNQFCVIFILIISVRYNLVRQMIHLKGYNVNSKKVYLLY